MLRITILAQRAAPFRSQSVLTAYVNQPSATQDNTESQIYLDSELAIGTLVCS
jgi:hypothetical protein